MGSVPWGGGCGAGFEGEGGGEVRGEGGKGGGGGLVRGGGGGRGVTGAYLASALVVCLSI